jgi:peptide deformylase
MIKKLPILLEGDPILREICTPVKYVHQEEMDLALSMTHTMVHANGIGLAAPQIGKTIQLIVMDTLYVDKFDGASAIMFNPELLHGEGRVTYKEGCLSIPKKFVEVERFAKIKVKYLNIQNKTIIREFKGLAAIVIQHEMDHLVGVILSDHEQGKEP